MKELGLKNVCVYYFTEMKLILTYVYIFINDHQVVKNQSASVSLIGQELFVSK